MEDLTDLEGIVEDLLELDEVWLPDLKNEKECNEFHEFSLHSFNVLYIVANHEIFVKL